MNVIYFVLLFVLLKMLRIIIASKLARNESPFLIREQRGQAVHSNQSGENNPSVQRNIYGRSGVRRKTKYSSGIYLNSPKLSTAVNKTQQLPTSNCTNGSICVAHKHWGSVLNIKINIHGQSDGTLVFYNNPDRGRYRSGVVWTTADNDRAKSSRLHENFRSRHRLRSWAILSRIPEPSDWIFSLIE